MKDLLKSYFKRFLIKFIIALIAVPVFIYLLLLLNKIIANFSEVILANRRLFLGFIILILASVIFYVIKPALAKALLLKLGKLLLYKFQDLTRFIGLNPQTEKDRNLALYLKNWKQKFAGAPPKQKSLMLIKPLTLLLILYFIIRVAPSFVPPKIATSFPGNLSAEAPLDSKIEIYFDREVIKPMAEKSFTLSPKVEGSLSWEGKNKLVFTPKVNLERGRKYAVKFEGLVLSNFLMPLLGNKTLSFETIGNPKVIIASPKFEALEDLSPITVVFDRPMIPLTTATNSAVKQPAFKVLPPIDGEGRWLGTTAFQFRPEKPFKQATTYIVSVPGGTKSQDGGVMEQEYTWEFSSKRPRIDAVTPLSGSQYANPVGSISATFNQDIDAASFAKHFELFDKNRNKIDGRVVVNGKRIIGFYPSTPLSREEYFEAVVRQGVESMDGPNGMENDYRWAFRTAALPVITGSNPVNGQKDILEQHTISVYFKTPMDESSFKDNVSIDPKPDTDPSLYFNSYNSANTLSIGTYLGRSSEYKITISGNVKDQYDVPLGQSYSFNFSTAPYKPSVSIYPSDTYFGSFNQHVIPRVVVQAINSKQVNYALYKLKREDLLDLYRRRYGNQCGQDYDCRNWQNYNPAILEKIKNWNENFEADFNTPVQVVTKVTDKNGGQIPSGIYLLEVRIPQGAHDNLVMIVSKSTLTVKKSNKQIFVWAVDQASTNVASNMKMQLTDSYGTAITDGNTNNDGVFMKDVDLLNRDDLFVFGQDGDDAVVAASAWKQGIDRYDFGLPYYYDYNEQKDYYAKDNYKLFITMDRPIYRPGHHVYFKGVIRKDNDGAYENIQPNELVEVTITDARQRSVFTQSLPLSTFGSFSADFTLSRDANLGYYQVKASYKNHSFNQSFQVEEYRKPELAVEVKPSKNAYSQGETADVTINASYYFGAPVTNAPVDWSLQTSDYTYRWDKDWRFEFGDPESYWTWWYSSNYSNSENLTYGKGKTNSRGNLEINYPLDISKQKNPQVMTLEATVNDISNQSIAASQEFIVHKANLYAGIRPVSYTNQAGRSAKAEIVTVDLKGKELTDVPVTVEFYKRTWEEVREKDPDNGQFYYVSKPKDSLVSTQKVTTGNTGRATASFTPDEGGTYKVVSRVSDKNGNQSQSGSFLWVSGAGYEAERQNNDRIILITDKKDYLVGEDLSVFVASPFASSSAKTLLTAERGTVLDYKIVDTNEKSNNFNISIPPKFSPNVFIGAVLVKGGDKVKNPAEFKIGYTEIKVTDKKQQLNVKITTDKKRYKPGETLKATIETKDVLGYPAATELAVGLVDKAVWDLGRADLADIYKTFYQPRNLEVSNAQLLTISIDRINANTNLGSKGGSGGGCFTGETPVLMKGGIYKEIKDIKIGDVVLTRENDKSSKLVEAKVTKTYKHLVNEYLIINGNLRVTPVHRMFVNNQWITAGEIIIGDYLLDKNNKPVRVFSVEQVMAGQYDVYNLEIEKYRTYFAHDFYVHNQKGGGADTSRQNFPDTAYWNPTLKTDNNGHAELAVKLPDSLTTWRLGVIANSRDAAFGSGNSEVIVSRDVIIRPFMPRFLSIGDQAKLGAIVVNTSGEDQAFKIRIAATGLDVKDTAVKEQTIADGGQAKILWQTVAKPVKSAKVKFTVEGSDKVVKDSIELPLPINSYSIPEVVATSGQAKDSAEEKIVLPKELDKSQGEMKLTFSPSLGSSSIDSIGHVLDYPYFCIEQISSRLNSAVFVNRVLKNAKLEGTGTVNTTQLKFVINDAIQRLNNQQKPNGGWGWWIEYDSDPFLTAYAYSGLTEARKDGFAVPDQVLKKAEDYLKNRLSFTDRQDKNISYDSQAYILYVLKNNNKDLSATASVLFEHRFEMSLEARAYLLTSIKDMPGLNTQKDRLYDELLSLSKKTSTTTHWEENRRYYYLMGDSTTATAAMLEAITSVNKNSPLIPEVVRYLMSIRKDNHWETTRSTAAVIKAISTQLLITGEQNVDENYRLSLNGKMLKEGSLTRENLLKLEKYIISISNFKTGQENKLTISKSGTGNLYYNMDMKYYLPYSEIKPLERGMVVVREFVDENGRVLPKNKIDENTEVWVRLTVVAPEERHFVMVEDLLPAGLESVNESLKNVALSKNQPPVKAGTNYFYFGHKEYRDDRTILFADNLYPGVYEVTYRVRATTPGRYHYPPAQAYQMYVPDVSGHSDGGWLEVLED